MKLNLIRQSIAAILQCFVARLKFFFVERVPITRKAISHIPYVEYKNFSKNENNLMQHESKALLKKARFFNLSREVNVIFCLKNSKRKRVVYGNSVEVKLGKDYYAWEILTTKANVISIHNHPNGSIFSIADIRTFLICDNLILSVVVTNRGNIMYLQKDNSYDSTKAWNLLNSCKKKSPSQLVEAELFLQKCSGAGIYYGIKNKKE